MRSLVVVKVKVTGQALPCLTWVEIFVQIDLLIFDRAPQPFGEDVIEGAPPAIHTDLGLNRPQPVEILRAGKVATLIAVADDWFGLSQGPINSGEHKGQLQGLVQFPTDDIAGEPIQ